MASNSPIKSRPPISVIKPSFTGGEYSPNLWTRIDLEKYASGAKTLRNFFVHPQGGASNRPGTFYAGVAKRFYNASNVQLEKEIRMLPFEFSTDQKYAIEAGDSYMRFFAKSGGVGGQIIITTATAWVTTHAYVVGDYVTQSSVIYYCQTAHTSGTFATDLAAGKWVAQVIYEIPSPYVEAQLPDIQYTQSADVLFMVHDKVKPKQLNRFGHTNWTITDYDFQDGPFMLPNTTSTTLTINNVSGTGRTLTASANVFDPLHVGALFKLEHFIEGQVVTSSFTATGTSSSIKCGGTWRIITHGTWTAKLNVERSIDGGSTWQVIRTFAGANDNNVTTFQTDDNGGDPYLVRLNCYNYTSGTLNVDLTTDSFTQTGVCKVTAYNSATVVTVDVKREIGNTTATKTWAEGSWSDYRGWPRGIAFNQDRLVFLGTRTEPQTEWQTETGNYYSFRRHSPLLDTDGITTNLPSRQLNAPSWLLSLGDLITGTSGAIWDIKAQDGVFTPTSIVQRAADYSGANPVLPVTIGNRAIYVQAGGSVIRDLGFDFASDGYVSTNISILATHLFENYKITRLAYQQNPHSLMWAVRDDGKMLSMTYLREQDVLAWCQHDTSGYFEDVIALHGAETDEIWLAVRREADVFIELMADRMISEATQDQYFVDCGIVYNGVPTTVITGLDHLNGKNVAVLADGNVVADYYKPKIVQNGQISLGGTYTKVIVGRPYLCDLQTLRFEVPSQIGTAQGKKAQISKISVQVLRSLGGLIGPKFGDPITLSGTGIMHEMGGQYSRDYTTALGLFTGDLQENLGAGFEEGADVCIRQAAPLPLSVLSLIPDVKVGGKTLVSDFNQGN